MIKYRITDSQIAFLEGRIIFHNVMGADLYSVLMPPSTVKIGSRLGKVSRINGPNRIFYVAADGSEKYVGTKGIGYICDTEEEASKLGALRDEITEKIKVAVTAAHAELEERLKALENE